MTKYQKILKNTPKYISKFFFLPFAVFVFLGFWLEENIANLLDTLERRKWK